jgi:hypothetical protein
LLKTPLRRRGRKRKTPNLKSRNQQRRLLLWPSLRQICFLNLFLMYPRRKNLKNQLQV